MEQHTATPAKKLARTVTAGLLMAFLFAGAHGASGTEILPNDPMRTKVALRVSNQNAAGIFKALASAAGMPAEYTGGTLDVVPEWRASGELHQALEDVASKFGLCIYFDGIKIHAVSAASADIEIINIKSTMPGPKEALQFAIPWFSSNAIQFDRAKRKARVCGSSDLVEVTRNIFNTPSRNRIVIIRYAVPDRLSE